MWDLSSLTRDGPSPLHCKAESLPLDHQGSPRMLSSCIVLKKKKSQKLYWSYLLCPKDTHKLLRVLRLRQFQPNQQLAAAPWTPKFRRGTTLPPPSPAAPRSQPGGPSPSRPQSPRPSTWPQEPTFSIRPAASTWSASGAGPGL